MEHSALTAEPTNRGQGTDQISRAVVDAVAGAEDVDPTDLTPLYTAIDPDALESVFQSGPGDAGGSVGGEIRFSYQGYEVRVTAAGEVSLDAGSDR